MLANCILAAVGLNSEVKIVSMECKSAKHVLKNKILVRTWK